MRQNKSYNRLTDFKTNLLYSYYYDFNSKKYNIYINTNIAIFISIFACIGLATISKTFLNYIF